jgi:integrase
MAFVIDKQELKTGLIIFRRGDVKHETWYCRLKLPKTDRYKTTSLATTDVDEARVRALDHEADIQLRLKYDITVFTPCFRLIARKYLDTQKARAGRGEISRGRADHVRAILEGVLDT